MQRKMNETRAEAERVLAKMNAMIRDRDFAKMCADDEYCRLNGRIHELGWLALINDMKIRKTATGNDIRIRLKLVSPDSKEARDLP